MKKLPDLSSDENIQEVAKFLEDARNRIAEQSGVIVSKFFEISRICNADFTIIKVGNFNKGNNKLNNRNREFQLVSI